MMLLCKKCGCLVVFLPGEVVPQQSVQCVTPNCLNQQFRTGKNGDAAVKAYVEENCNVLQIEDALDRESKLVTLLWWISARKEITSEREHAEGPAPQLLTVEAAVEEVVAYHSRDIASTLVRKKK